MVGNFRYPMFQFLDILTGFILGLASQRRRSGCFSNGGLGPYSSFMKASVRPLGVIQVEHKAHYDHAQLSHVNLARTSSV